MTVRIIIITELAAGQSLLLLLQLHACRMAQLPHIAFAKQCEVVIVTIRVVTSIYYSYLKGHEGLLLKGDNHPPGNQYFTIDSDMLFV